MNTQPDLEIDVDNIREEFGDDEPSILNCTDDAQGWAKAFKELIIDKGVEIDEDLMLGWFANVIELSHDHRTSKYEEESSYDFKNIVGLESGDTVIAKHMTADTYADLFVMRTHGQVADMILSRGVQPNEEHISLLDAAKNGYELSLRDIANMAHYNDYEISFTLRPMENSTSMYAGHTFIVNENRGLSKVQYEPFNDSQ